MPQYIIKLNPYDPATIDVLEQLRKSRKLAAFTNEALKFFLQSEKGTQVINLMICRKPNHNCACAIDEKPDAFGHPAKSGTELSSGPAQGKCMSVLEEILK
ncbi:hypothetical protein [Geobacter sp. DSM 9736]|uniref:hypothetical protein n=1 Tax=Geobacter sp. DSM 9736 TaxID=1277350 RepID=UPI000B500E82|nr:hypothetical protein [Geobacter sp. DSM 9736]SNB45411.1 hypothetical protein SAMN06269301_0824 [Geobacter sp. DSM 9736]